MSQDLKITVRPAASGDTEALGRLGAMLVAVHHGFDPERFIAPGPDAAAGYGRFLASRLEREDSIVLVAEKGPAVVGYVYAGVEGNDWMSLRGPAGVIYDVLVDPACRDEGAGRLLLEQVLQALHSRGVPRVLLSAAQKNEGAQRLFASLGFRPTMIEMTREWPD